MASKINKVSQDIATFCKKNMRKKNLEELLDQYIKDITKSPAKAPSCWAKYKALHTIKGKTVEEIKESYKEVKDSLVLEDIIQQIVVAKDEAKAQKKIDKLVAKKMAKIDKINQEIVSIKTPNQDKDAPNQDKDAGKPKAKAKKPTKKPTKKIAKKESPPEAEDEDLDFLSDNDSDSDSD